MNQHLDTLAWFSGRIGVVRTGVLALLVGVLLLVPACGASADIIVSLAGPGAGTVESSTAGKNGNKIDCANVGGDSPGSHCSESFPTFSSGAPSPIELTAAAGSGYVFEGWSGDDPLGFFFPPGASCNASSASSCFAFDPQEFSEANSGSVPPDTHITATFGCVAPVAPPTATTGAAGPGADFSLRELEGEVNPEGCGLEESFFEYGATTNYGHTSATEPGVAAIGTGSEPVQVSAETEPLEPETTYHYRLVAVGPGGTSHGEDRTFTTGSAPTGSCPNEAIRHEQGIAALLLPDCMALEMASPPQKLGSPAKFPNVSADGSRVSFIAVAALGENPPGLPGGTGVTYVASRDGAGWTSESTLPNKGLSALWESLFAGGTHLRFTPDFSRWLGIGSTAAQQGQGIDQAYEAGLGGFFRPLSGPLVPFSMSTLPPYEVVQQASFQGASANHSHLYFEPGNLAKYSSGDPSLIGPGAEPGYTYLARSTASGEPVLELLQRDRAGKVWGGECGARLGGIGPRNGERNQGAISADGSLTYFSARAAQPQEGNCSSANKLRILERLETPEGVEIFPLFGSECSRPSPDTCSTANGDDLYQGASLDQSKVYFTTNRQLADSDSDGSGEECSAEEAVTGCDLYLYDRSRPVGERLIQVSAGEELGAGVHERGQGAEVYNGVTAISGDGSHVYFAAAGVLTDHPNPQGDTAQPGRPNLYLWDAGSEETSFVATLDSEDGITLEHGYGLWGAQGTWLNDAYPVPVLSQAEQSGERGTEGGDGHILVFESQAELTPNDRDGRHLDVYRYDSDSDSLQCLSCAPGSSESEPDEAPFDVEPRGEATPPGTDYAEIGRWASEDGEAVGFMTPEKLLPGDVNGAKDGYLWRRGSLARLPGLPFAGGRRGDGPFLSHDGTTVAFGTVTPLLRRDGDVSGDIYVARVDGGFPEPPSPNPCEPGSDCQESQAGPKAPPASSESATGRNVKSNSCARQARQARRLSKSAKLLQHQARLLRSRGLSRGAHRMVLAAQRRAGRAQHLAQRAKRCRRGEGRASR